MRIAIDVVSKVRTLDLKQFLSFATNNHRVGLFDSPSSSGSKTKRFNLIHNFRRISHLRSQNRTAYCEPLVNWRKYGADDNNSATQMLWRKMKIGQNEVGNLAEELLTVNLEGNYYDSAQCPDWNQHN